MKRAPHFDREAVEMMCRVRTRLRWSWEKIARIVCSSPSRVRRLCENHEKRVMRAQGSTIRWMHRDLRGKRT